MTALAISPSRIEELILSGFHEGHVAYKNPPKHSDIAAQFLEEKASGRSLPDLAEDRIAHNHLAYLMAEPSERFDDDLIEQYAELAEYLFRSLAAQDA